MKPTDRSLDHPAIHTQATAVGRASLGQLRVDPAAAQLLALSFIVEAAVAHRMVRALTRRARLAGDGGNRIDQRHGQVGVGRVRRDRIDHQGHALAVGGDRVFAPGPRPIHGTRSGLFTPTHGADVTGIDDESLEVDLVGVSEVGQQDLVNLIPDAGGLPVAQAIPTGHAAPAAHLLRQVFPRDAGLEDEDDPGEDVAIVQEGSSALGLGGMGWDQGLNQFPKFVRE
jgi:hypothetical protein